MTKLQGPLAISLTSLVCPDCGSEKKNMNGLHEHMRHCRASQARLEQERAARLALEASRAPRNHTLMGVTMRLKCTKGMDKTTPNDFLKEHVEVAFNLDNYGKRWYLLDEVDA